MVLCISYVIMEIIGYVDAASGSPDLKVSTNSNSRLIVSSDMFYSVLFYLVFESKSAKLVHLRDDLGLIRKATVFEKFVRTIESNIIRDLTIQLNSTSNSRLILKSWSFIMIQNMGQMDQALFL